MTLKIIYKKVNKLVPHCSECGEELSGTGSMVSPYYCRCGDWEWDFEKTDYILIKSTNDQAQ